MNLSEALNDAESTRRAKRDPALTAKMDKATDDLATSGMVDSSLQVGQSAPDFELSNVKGEQVSLKNALANGPVVLSFYRGGWCPYCNLELRYLQQFLPQFQDAGATLIAVSPQMPDASLSTQEKEGLEFEVLSDVGNKVAREYGLVFTLPESLHAMYGNLEGINLAKDNGDDSFELPVPATYLIDKNGTIKYAFAHADYTKRAEPEDVLKALKAIED